MGEKKFDFKAVGQDAGRNASKKLGKAKDAVIRVADQTDDGKFDKEDISAIADSVGEKVKTGTQAFMESAGEKTRQI